MHYKHIQGVEKNISPIFSGTASPEFIKGMSSAKHGNGIIPLKDVITELTNQGYCKRWVIELSMDGSDSYMEAAVHAKNAVQLVSTSPSLL